MHDKTSFYQSIAKINEQYMVLDMKVKKLQNSISNKIKEEKTKYVKSVAKLDALSPLKTLARGYSIVSLDNEKDKDVIISAKQLKKDDKINVKFADGDVKAIIS